MLGAGLSGDRVTPLLAGRLARGREVYERSRAASPETDIVVSGGQGADELVSEAQARYGWLIERGVPADDVLLEDRSRSTEENLLFSGQVLEAHGKAGPVAVISSNYQQDPMTI